MRQGQDYKTKIKTKTGAVLNHSPASVPLYKTMWQTTAKLCESDKHVSLSQHVRTSVQ